jgi:hypothetical protein
MENREDIVSLFSRIEAFKEADPRSKGSVDDLISLYVDISSMITAAGWGIWEYEGTLAHHFS